jgi:GTPase SAR1 family protein
MLCFSVVEPDSFAHIREKWVPEVREAMSYHTRLVVVGTKADLRTKSTVVDFLKKTGKKPVPRKDGEDLAAEIHAAAYVEVSALTNDGLATLTDALARALQSPSPSVDSTDPATTPASQATTTTASASSSQAPKCKCIVQ